jgi:hypothetical protein
MSQRRCGPRRWCRPGTRRGGIPPRAGRVAGRCQGRKAIRRTRLPERADFTTGSPYQSPARNPHPHPSPPHRGSDISHPRPAPAGIFARPRDARQTAIRQIRASADRRTMRVAAYRSAGSARHWVAPGRQPGQPGTWSPSPAASGHPGRAPVHPCAVTPDQFHRQEDGPRAAGTTDGDASAPRRSGKTLSAAVEDVHLRHGDVLICGRQGREPGLPCGQLLTQVLITAR